MNVGPSFQYDVYIMTSDLYAQTSVCIEMGTKPGCCRHFAEVNKLLCAVLVCRYAPTHTNMCMYVRILHKYCAQVRSYGQLLTPHHTHESRPGRKYHYESNVMRVRCMCVSLCLHVYVFVYECVRVRVRTCTKRANVCTRLSGGQN
jgi:hypothetical protein